MKTHPPHTHLRATPLLLLALNLSACGGQATAPITPPTPITHPSPPPSAPTLTSLGDDATVVREELDRISQRIARERAQATPQATEVEDLHAAPRSSPEPSSDLSPRCSTDTCPASEGICGSAQTICAIAQRHPTDPDFSQSCQWANDRCADASSQCKRCQ
jgi:hypothetical protein